jgi:hypothetical protein
MEPRESLLLTRLPCDRVGPVPARDARFRKSLTGLASGHRGHRFAAQLEAAPHQGRSIRTQPQPLDGQVDGHRAGIGWRRVESRYQIRSGK